MSSKTLILLIVILGIAGGVFFLQNKFRSTENDFGTTQQNFDQDKKEQTTQNETKKPAQAPITSSKGTYESYGPEKIARAAQEKVILFFHAPWCPTCKRLDADIQKNSDKIPGGIVILKTDYDSEVALKQKYGVTYQHTFVQVDANGNLISKWSGSPTLSEFLEKVI
jgi:thiol-disulfide isomerase/thioredoxin